MKRILSIISTILYSITSVHQTSRYIAHSFTKSYLNMYICKYIYICIMYIYIWYIYIYTYIIFYQFQLPAELLYYYCYLVQYRHSLSLTESADWQAKTTHTNSRQIIGIINIEHSTIVKYIFHYTNKHFLESKVLDLIEFWFFRF